ncbi:MAG TPA: class I SAM-dependent methyltransferase [Chitinophagaceae bacterium]|jgi:SAM-dependent methyltransferase
MSVFKDYSDYYDLLYKDKDYRGEAARIHEVVQRHAPGAKTMLNLGCGTGNHDFYLHELGYDITGVDLSDEMIAQANSKLKSGSKGLHFVKGDVRDVRLSKTFDVVISLFHVMSYQATNDDVLNMFKTAAAHLNVNGTFVYDCWYGPGVLSEPPATRYKVLENARVKIHRVAEPVMYFDKNLTDVQYRILVENKQEKSFYSIEEVHTMRYLFQPELKLFAGLSGMDTIYAGDWYHDGKPLTNEQWQALFITKKTAG